jgi:hypothetical protein
MLEARLYPNQPDTHLYISHSLSNITCLHHAFLDDVHCLGPKVKMSNDLDKECKTLF